MNPVERAVRVVDRFQQRHPVVGFPYAVIKKSGDDEGGALAGLIAYYGFFSLFPLLLVLVSVLGIVLEGNPKLRQDIVDSAFSEFPVIGSQLSRTAGLHALGGSWLSVAVGSLAAVWAGLAVAHAAQRAMNTVWDVPRSQWPNFLFRRLRAVLFLGVLLSLVLASTFTSGLASSGALPSEVLVVAPFAISLVLNLTLFFLVYKVLTVIPLHLRDLVPGVITAAVMWTAIQVIGGYYVTHQLKSASNTYGTFALVFGLLVWIALGAQVMLYGAEVNVVRKKRLWPRSIVQPPLTEGDKRAYAAIARRARMRPEMQVDVSYLDEITAAPDGTDGAGTVTTEAEPRRS